MSFEVTKQYVFYAKVGENSASSGWRLDAFWDNWSVGLGEEVRGGWTIDTDQIGSDWLRQALRETKWSAYGTAGLRGMQIENESYFLFNSITDNVAIATAIDHDLFGPQFGVGVVAEASMFRFEAALLGLLGYGHAEAKQWGEFATANIWNKQTSNYFAWQGEARLTGSCQLTQRLRFDATWRGLLTGSVRDATAATAFNAPNFGLYEDNGNTMDLNNWFFGLTYTH